MPYSGSCHCGAVAFAVDADLPGTTIACNCSHCRRKGFLLTFVPVSVFRLVSGHDDLVTYRFHTHRLAHRFCRLCGTQPFAEGTDSTGAQIRAVNLRCVPEAVLDELEIQAVDGASY